MHPHRRHISRWLEILSELHHFPALLPYFSLGMIRPADWAGAQLDRMWIIDFGQLLLSDSEKHEMMLYRSVRAIIEHMFVFWDATSGTGVLGLKGLNTLNPEGRLNDAKAEAFSSGMQHFIKDLFAQQAEVREWTAVPELINLDL